MKIAVGLFQHETVTFLARPTQISDYVYDGSPRGGENLLRSCRDPYLRGFVKAAEEYCDVELVGLTSPMEPRTGIGSGWITRDCYEYLLGRMLADVLAHSDLDGVYLALHGAMAVEGVPKPEADIARRVRAAVGDDVVIVATFDPHGNEDEEFLRSADLAFCAKYYPHYDSYLQGARAARALVRAARGDILAKNALVKIPIITPTVVQWTGGGAWASLVDRALNWEARHPDLYVNVFFGFPWSDVPDVGMTVQASADRDERLASRAAEDVAAYAWSLREGLVHGPPVRSTADGVAEAIRLSARSSVVVADYSDRAGSSTWCLHEVLSQGASNTVVATVADENFCRAAESAQLVEGDPVDLVVGADNPMENGPPVRLIGTLLRARRPSSLGDKDLVNAAGDGHWYVVELDRGNLVVVSPHYAEIRSPQAFEAILSVDVAHVRTFVLKSRVHFRRGFVDSGYTGDVILVEPPYVGAGSADLRQMAYTAVSLDDFYPYGCLAFTPEVVIASRARVASTSRISSPRQQRNGAD